MPDAIPFNRSTKAETAPKSDAATEELLAFERMLADLSARFANVPADKVELEIRVVQAILLKFLGFDRCTFAEVEDDGSLVVLSSTAVEGVDATPLGPLPAQLDWFVARLRAGQMLAVQDPAYDLPPEAVGEAEYFRRTGMHSHLSIPFRIGGRIIGAVAFAAFRDTRPWPDDLIARLTLVGEIFAHAVARKREQEKLLCAIAEIKVLKDRLERENAYLKDAAQVRPPQGIVGRSPLFLSMLDEIGQVAQTDSTVLLLGETGTGKEGLAQAIHDASARKDRPMVKVNCAALPAALHESDLFGREKGAFTGALARQAGRFEIADGSTIFLDEVGELPLELQPKLLRVLQEGEFRLTRSLADFAKLVELFDAHGVSFVSVTQQFNTTTSMGRLTLNVLLSFAQFEREVTSERIRDKIAASKRKGRGVGGGVPRGYELEA